MTSSSLAGTTSRPGPPVIADTAMTCFIAALGCALWVAGATIAGRWNSPGNVSTGTGVEESIGLAASGLGLTIMLWWVLSLMIACVAALLCHTGHRRTGAAIGRYSPTFMRRFAAVLLGVQLLAAPVAAASQPPTAIASAASWSGAGTAGAAAGTAGAGTAGAAAGTAGAGTAGAAAGTAGAGTAGAAAGAAGAGTASGPGTASGSAPSTSRSEPAPPTPLWQPSGTFPSPQHGPSWKPSAPLPSNGLAVDRRRSDRDAADRSERRQVTVLPGDSLWAIAAEALGPYATDVEIAEEWPRWYAENRTVIGPDPGLIYPGQVLQAPEGQR